MDDKAHNRAKGKLATEGQECLILRGTFDA